MGLTKNKLLKMASEPEMLNALIRLAFLAWGSTFLFIGMYFDYYPISYLTSIIALGTYGIFCSLVIVSVIKWPNVIWRLYFTLVIDLAFISIGIIFTGDSTSPFFFLYIWVLIGQAIRYGRNLLFTGAAISFVFYIFVIIYFSDFSKNILETLFFLITLIIMPLYLDKLLRQLHKARKEADTANKTKSMFMANMSHELRTPLNAIIGYSEMLKEDAIDLGYDVYAKDLSKIRNAGLHLLTLINTILDFSKIEAGKIELDFTIVNVSELLEDIYGTIIIPAKKNLNKFTINSPNQIDDFYTDKIKLTQTLFNLLSNACKFTREGSIELNVSTEIKNNIKYIIFTIKDTGIGIAKDKLNLLFNPFTQASTSTTRLYGGTGLGLTISEQFVLLMKGEIKVESILNEGTTFTVSLPAYEQVPSTI